MSPAKAKAKEKWWREDVTWLSSTILPPVSDEARLHTHLHTACNPTLTRCIYSSNWACLTACVRTKPSLIHPHPHASTHTQLATQLLPDAYTRQTGCPHERPTPLCKPNSPVSQTWLYLPFPFTILGPANCFIHMSTKKAGKNTQWVACWNFWNFVMYKNRHHCSHTAPIHAL
jgi:hypothetical protein